jgi:hypothetical protein
MKSACITEKYEHCPLANCNSTSNLLLKKNSIFTYTDEHGKMSKLHLKASTLQLLYTAMQNA